MALNEGAIRVGDVITFGENPKRFIVETVDVAEGKIQAFSFRPAASEGEEKG